MQGADKWPQRERGSRRTVAMGKGMQETSTTLTPQLSGGHGQTEAIPSRKTSHRERASYSSTQAGTCHSVTHLWPGAVWRRAWPSLAEQSPEYGPRSMIWAPFATMVFSSFFWVESGTDSNNNLIPFSLGASYPLYISSS